MNVGHRNTLARALRADNAPASTARHGLLQLLANDEEKAAYRPKPKLPEITFTKRSLPGESRWARERIEPKVVE